MFLVLNEFHCHFYFCLICFILTVDVPAALLYQQVGQQDQDQLKVLFSGDLIGLSEDFIDNHKDFGFSAVQIQNFKAAKVYSIQLIVKHALSKYSLDLRI